LDNFSILLCLQTTPPSSKGVHHKNSPRHHSNRNEHSKHSPSRASKSNKSKSGEARKSKEHQPERAPISLSAVVSSSQGSVREATIVPLLEQVRSTFRQCPFPSLLSLSNARFQVCICIYLEETLLLTFQHALLTVQCSFFLDNLS